MGIDKAHLKSLLLTEIGADIEDQHEQSLKAAHEIDGAASALMEASKHLVAQVCPQVDAHLASGLIKDMGALEVAEQCKRYIITCGGLLKNQSLTMRQNSVSQYGEARGVKATMAVVSKMLAKEQTLIARIAEVAAMPEDTVLRGADRPSGVHPGPSMAAARKNHGTLAERRAEAKAIKAAEAKTPQAKPAPAKPKAVQRRTKPKAKATRRKRAQTRKPKLVTATEYITPERAATLKRREAAKQKVG